MKNPGGITGRRIRYSAPLVPGICALLLTAAAGVSPAAAAGRRVIVLPFEGPAAEEIQNVIGPALPAEYAMVPPDQVQRSIQQAGGRLDPSPDGYGALARRLRAAALMEGRITKDDRWRLRLVVRQGSSGAMAGTVTWAGARLKELVANVQRGAPYWLQSMLDEADAVPAPRPREAVSRVALAPRDRGDRDYDEAPVTTRSRSSRASYSDSGSPDSVGSSRLSRQPPMWEVSLGPRVLSRTFTYTDNLSGLPGYTLPSAPAIVGQGELYPGANGRGAARNFGIAGYFETSVGAKTQDRSGAPSRTTSLQAYRVGARYRFTNENLTLLLGGDYGEHKFQMDVQDTIAPNVRYTFIRPSITGRAELAGGLSLILTTAYLHILSVGDMDDKTRFPRITAVGAEVDAGVGYAMDNDFEIRLLADLRHYAHSMHVRAGDPLIVGGALDEHFGASLVISYRSR
jgi:hypothetical protein